MKTLLKSYNFLLFLTMFTLATYSCTTEPSSSATQDSEQAEVTAVLPEYYSLRPDLEKAFGYTCTHAVKIDKLIKISGAVSMDDQGNSTARGDLRQQMINCYSDIKKILKHYDCSFDDVIVENIYTTDMSAFLQNADYRSEIYTEHFPTGTWVGVKELAVPDFLIEIEIEAYKSN